MRPRLPTRLSLLPVLLLSACAEDFTPGSVVEDLRILTLVAEPPELVVGQPVTVTAVTAAPDGAPPVTQAWSFCPFSTGAATGYACALPKERFPLCERDGLGTGPSVTLDPTALVAECVASLGGSLPTNPGGPIPDQVEVLVRHVATDGGGRAREAVQRIPVWTVAPTSALNTAPAFEAAALRFSTAQGTEAPAVACADPAQPGTAACPRAGTLPRGGRVTVEAAVTPASFETYQAAGRTITESLTVSFFTTAGRFTDERGNPAPGAPTTATELKHEKLVGDPRWVLVWAVLRDLRGGQAAAGPYLLEVPAAN